MYICAKGAEELFIDISVVFHSRCAKASHSPLSSKKLEAIKSLCQVLAKFTARHFEAFFAGKLVSCTEFASPPSRVPQITWPVTYARAARQAPKVSTVYNPNKFAPAKSTMKPVTNRPRTGDHLFVRMSKGEKLRDL